jgi:hypothetical protein
MNTTDYSGRMDALLKKHKLRYYIQRSHETGFPEHIIDEDSLGKRILSPLSLGNMARFRVPSQDGKFNTDVGEPQRIRAHLKGLALFVYNPTLADSSRNSRIESFVADYQKEFGVPLLIETSMGVRN